MYHCGQLVSTKSLLLSPAKSAVLVCRLNKNSSNSSGCDDDDNDRWTMFHLKSNSRTMILNLYRMRQNGLPHNSYEDKVVTEKRLLLYGRYFCRFT